MSEYGIGDMFKIIDLEYCIRSMIGKKLKIVGIETDNLYNFKPLGKSHCNKDNCISFQNSIQGCTWHIDNINVCMKQISSQNRNGANK